MFRYASVPIIDRPAFWRLIPTLLILWALLGGGPAALAASSASGPAELLTPGDSTAATLAQPADEDPATLRQLLDSARNEAAQGSPAPPAGASPDETLEQSHFRDELVGALEHHLDVLERLPDARRRQTEQKSRTQGWTALPSSTPLSILQVDLLREAWDSARLQADAATTRETLTDQQVEEYTKHLKDAEIASRQSEERIAQAQTPEQRDRQIWLRDLARLRSRAAAAVIAESLADKTLTGIEAAEQRSLATLLEKQLDAARKTAQFSQADLDGVLATLDRRRVTLEKRSAQLKNASLKSRQALAQTQRQLTEAKAEMPGADENADLRNARLDLLERRTALRRIQADNDDLAYDMTRRIMEVESWERTGWQYRWLLLNSADRDKLHDALTKIDGLIARLESWGQYVQDETLRAERQGDSAAPSGHGSPEETALAAEFRTARQERAEILRGGEQAVGNLLHTLELWRQDFLSRGADRSVRTVISDGWTALHRMLSAVWNFELFAAEDTLEIDGQRVTAVRSVTVGKSLGVILLVLFGSRLISQGLKGVKHLAVTHLRVPHNRADIMARWSHIVLLSMLVMVALYLVNIPLTVFAFLGGALAIGVGFGTQVMLKNMISGIMLLVERPLRLGDIVEVGTVVGTVTNISIRSSTVRTSDGIEILVPNSTFVENNVTNWTYSNPRVRRSVTVGADYAAPPKKVEAVLLAVAARHPAVLPDPPPRVLLTDFGSDAMHFTLRYWIDYGGGADGSQIASDLRFMMAEALAEAGIAIPFPQRVVHIKTMDGTPAPAGQAEASLPSDPRPPS